MTYKELVEIAIAGADEIPGTDTALDTTVKKAINQGYMIVATTIDKQAKTATLQYSESGMELPSDYFQLISLKKGDTRLSANDFHNDTKRIFITNKDYKNGEFTLEYYYFPDLLVNDDDEPIVNIAHHTLIAEYGTYEALLYRKKYQSATTRLNFFISRIGGDEKDEF